MLIFHVDHAINNKIQMSKLHVTTKSGWFSKVFPRLIFRSPEMPLQKVKIPEGIELFGEGLILFITGHEPLQDQSTNPDFF